jgi:hypothetical protein
MVGSDHAEPNTAAVTNNASARRRSSRVGETIRQLQNPSENWEDFYAARLAQHFATRGLTGGSIAGQVLERNDVSVCLKHPGFHFDVLLTADLAALYQVWGRRETFAGPCAAARIRWTGRPRLPAPLPGWLGWGTVAASDGAEVTARTRAPRGLPHSM